MSTSFKSSFYFFCSIFCTFLVYGDGAPPIRPNFRADLVNIISDTSPILRDSKMKNNKGKKSKNYFNEEPIDDENMPVRDIESEGEIGPRDINTLERTKNVIKISSSTPKRQTLVKSDRLRLPFHYEEDDEHWYDPKRMIVSPKEYDHYYGTQIQKPSDDYTEFLFK